MSPDFDAVKDTEHYSKTYLIPKPLQAKVCMCLEPGHVLFGHGKRPNMINCCDKCLKPFRWNVRICTICRKHFIKDFRLKEVDCVKHTQCWDCIEHNKDCGLYKTCTCEKEQSTRPNFGPLGLNPRTFTAEELADIKPPF